MDKLVKKGSRIVDQGITLAEGQVLKRGAILGRITASGKYQEYDPAATNGLERPRAILAEFVDASGGDQKAVAYISGAFDYEEIKWTDAKHSDSARIFAVHFLNGLGIHIFGFAEGLFEAVTTTTTSTTSSSTTTTTT